MRHRAPVADLAVDNCVSLSTAHRCLHEAFDVIADQAPELTDVVEHALETGYEHWLLDGTLIATDRVHDSGLRPDRWYCGKHTRHGGNVQVACDPDGQPLWVSSVEPGSTHDLTAARRHVLPVLYPAAVRGLPVMADEGCIGAGAGVRVPVRRPGAGQVLDASTRGWNSYINADRAFVEHGIAHPKVRWRALSRVTLRPWRICAIIATALVLSSWENRY
ncbi:transposase family protein [Kineococcus esterisolvens]|uniref:transposase family protein n=1 Tax=unclassified Kineococcus TaxID=2621656 RepID=UPI003D7EF3E7